MARARKLVGIEAPPAAMRSYERALLRIRDVVWSHLKSSTFPALDAVLRGDRADDLSSALKRSLAQLAAKLARESSRISSSAVTIARGVDGRHKTLFYQRVKEAVGVEVVAAEGFRGKVLNAWERENAALIKSVIDTSAIRSEVEDAVASGLRHEVLAKRWRERGLPLRFGTVEGRAKVIARDQISKLNGQLTEARQRNIGITEYTWRTSRDQRVRDAHASLEGRRIKWDKPPAEGHPGNAVQCRCTAEAVLDVETIAAASSVRSVAQPARTRAALAAQPGGSP